MDERQQFSPALEEVEMDVHIVSGDRSSSGSGAVSAAFPSASRSAALSDEAVRSDVQDSVMLTVILAGTQRSYGYCMPDDAVLAAAVTSITAFPRASLGSQVLHLSAQAVGLLAG